MLKLHHYYNKHAPKKNKNSTNKSRGIDKNVKKYFMELKNVKIFHGIMRQKLIS